MFKTHLFPARQEWPTALTSIDQLPLDTTRIRLKADASDFEMLRRFEQLDALWCFNIDDRKLKQIARIESLQTLHLDYNLRTSDLSCLKELPNLKVLTLNSCSKITTLNQLGEFTNLEALRIENFKNVHDIKPLRSLVNLRELGVEGSIWTRMTIDSLASIEGLQKLVFASFTNLKVTDESLEPLSKLDSLTRVELPNFYPFQEFARLSAKLPHCECSWFSPYIQTNLTCPKCKQAERVMLSGKGKSMLCKQCDSEKLARHIKAFEAVKNTTT